MLLEWWFQLSLQSCRLSHFSWAYFYLRVLKGCCEGKNRTSLKERFLFGVLSLPFLCSEGIFRRGPLNTSHLQAVLLQYLLKYESFLSPAIFCLALPPGWLAEPHGIPAAPVFDLAHIELQSLGLGLKATASTYIKATLSTLPRTWETLFFTETNTFSFQS